MSSDLFTFTCRRHVGHLRLTPQGCAAMWRRARRRGYYDAADPVRPCRGCPIGARNAGHSEPVRTAHNDKITMSQTCVRCGNSNGRRLIANCLCISCWNRGREVLLGRNARGRPPRKLQSISGYVLSCQARTVQHVEVWVADLSEALATVLRKHHDITAFRWPPLSVPFKTMWDGSGRRPLQNRPAFRRPDHHRDITGSPT